MRRRYLIFILSVFLITPNLYAQDDKKLVSLSKQIIEAKTRPELYPLFKQLKELYCVCPGVKLEGGGIKDCSKYSDFVEFLKSLEAKKKGIEPFADYYISEARYCQLKYLEETQGWDEYFAKGNAYRDEITEGCQKAIASTAAEEPLSVYSRLLLWRFHKDQEDAFRDSALDDLMAAVRGYSQSSLADISVIKESADRLSSYGEKGKAKELYRIYVAKLVGSELNNQDLAKSASDFYKEGNLDLAETLYDVYIERVSKTMPKEKLIPVLIDIARSFSYGGSADNDPVYAEKIFKKIEEIGGPEAFDEGLIYLRALNLEKSKDFLYARDIYADLVRRFPKTSYANQADYKAGVASIYAARDIKTGRSYFKNLTRQETANQYVISSLYQLGLLAQWEGDSALAQEYYEKLLEKAKDNYQDAVSLAQERLKEIEGAKPLDNNLKTFLDIALKDEYKHMNMSRLELKSSLGSAKKGETITIGSRPYVGETGCMQVEVQYLWSGDTGTAKPSFQEGSFTTSYGEPGTKVVGLVVVGPSGLLDYDLNIIDIQ